MRLKQAQWHFNRDEYEPLMQLLWPWVYTIIDPASKALGLLMLARVYQSQFNFKQAIHIATQAVEACPHFGLAYYELGQLWLRMRHYDKALVLFEQGSHYDKTKQCLAQAGFCLKELGQLSAAKKCFVECLRDSNPSFWVMRQIISCEEYGGSCPTPLKTALEQTQTHDHERMNALFALGNLHHQAGEHELALTTIDQANGLRQQYCPFHSSCLDARLNTILSVCNRLPDRKVDSLDFTPIFIVGLSRTGKTTLESLLAQHPNIQARHETCFFADWLLAHTKSHQSFFAQFEEILTQQPHELIEQYAQFLRLGAMEDKTYFIDTTPYHVETIGLLHYLFPQAVFIYCSRSVDDLYWKIYFQYYAQGYSYAQSLEDIRYYHQSIEKLVGLWQSKYGIDLCRVDYEQLVTYPLQTVNHVLQNLGLSTLRSLKGQAQSVDHDLGFGQPYHALHRF